MYYIGEISENDLDIHGHPIIELWDGIGYTLPEAKKELKKIGKTNLQIISGKEYYIAKSQGWE